MKQIQIILGTILILISTMGVTNAEETTIMQINGEDATLPADTVLASYSYGDNLKGRLLDSGINFVLIENRSDGAPPALTVFASEDVDTICGWEGNLTKDILLRLSGNQVYCTE